MKKYLPIAIIILFTTAACSSLHPSLEYNTFANFKVDEISTSPTTLQISGLSMNSALVISEVRQVYNKETLDIFVGSRLVGKSSYGIADLNYVVVVPDYVSEVRFGEEHKVIWKRIIK